MACSWPHQSPYRLIVRASDALCFVSRVHTRSRLSVPKRSGDLYQRATELVAKPLDGSANGPSSRSANCPPGLQGESEIGPALRPSQVPTHKRPRALRSRDRSAVLRTSHSQAVDRSAGGNAIYLSGQRAYAANPKLNARGAVGARRLLRIEPALVRATRPDQFVMPDGARRRRVAIQHLTQDAASVVIRSASAPLVAERGLGARGVRSTDARQRLKDANLIGAAIAGDPN